MFVPEELKTKELCEMAVKISKNDRYGGWDDTKNLLRNYVPKGFKEELAEKYDLYLEPKAKGR